MTEYFWPPAIPPSCSFQTSPQLMDFGLARFYQSVSRGSKKDHDEGGTTSYMPPEAFNVSYKPTKASDIYR